jgi:hypothetical protein
MNTIVCEYHGEIESAYVATCPLCHKLANAVIVTTWEQPVWEVSGQYRRGLLTPTEALSRLGRLDLLPQKPQPFRCWCTKPAGLYVRTNGWVAVCEKHLNYDNASETAYKALRNNGESHLDALESMVKYIDGKLLAYIHVYSRFTKQHTACWYAWAVGPHYLVGIYNYIIREELTFRYPHAYQVRQSYNRFASMYRGMFERYPHILDDRFLHAEG